MITAKQVITTQPIEAITVFLNDYNNMVSAIGLTVTREIEPNLLDELRDTPPKVKYPIEWTSERQRRAFFATNGFGRGIPTKRTGKLQGAWRVVGMGRNGTYVLTITNPTAYLPFVVGTLNFKSARQAIQPMQQFHRNTGWQPIQPTIEFWFGVAQEEFTTLYNKELREFGQGIRITRTSRKS